MYTDVQICNLGLAKIGSARVTRLEPPVSALEVFMKGGYTAWKRMELAKRRWVFATEYEIPLTLTAELTEPEDDRKYEFALPTEVLRPVRMKRTEWRQAGRFLYSAYETLKITAVLNKAEAEFDPLFVDVLASWVGYQSVEFVTQSNSKKAEVLQAYKDAVKIAGQMNAFVIGPEDIQEDDNDFSFVTERAYPRG